MSVLNRPYVGTWALNNRGVVRHTPDALVYLNGNLEVAGCPTCGGRIDIQKYITAVSADCGVETGSGSATINLHVPRQEGSSLFRDGQLLLRPGLEVNIYMRGYFPVQGLLADVPPEQSGGVDVRSSVMYPYYHVFHGVVIETSYEYSGGEHQATLTCKDMLHFWAYQIMSTSGSYFGARPHNSGIKFTLTGHTFTEMTPFSIVYTLYRDVMGAAGGIGFALGSSTNADAKTETGMDMWSYALLYWEQRFSQNFNTLRMYGADGTLYNAYQQAFIGRLTTQETATLAKTYNDPATRSVDYNPLSNLLSNTARAVGYDVTSTYLGAQAESDAAKGGLGINANLMQAFLTDISASGQVNLFESVYETKMDIIQAVTRLTGYEFFQDVDGDFVFKPPFYNLDTSSSRTYVIRDLDIISINFSDSEPKVTALKVTSGHFANTTGLGIEGNEWGTRSAYIDYRLVAQFGWRQDTFECAYLTDPKAMLYACAARMDLFNIEMHRASCQIPIRPELRPGMPVYIEPFDCYFYLSSFSHSLAYGGQCTTTLTLVGRRAKFYAPGIAPEDGSKATVDNIKLTDPWLPPLPLEVVGNDGIPRLQGFPNVVMAIDTELLNPNFFSVGLNLINTERDIQALVRKAKDFGVLNYDAELTAGKSEREKMLDGPFVLRTGTDTVRKIPSTSDLLAQVKSYQQAYAQMHPSTQETKGVLTDRDLAQQNAADVQAILDRVLSLRGTAIEDGDQTANYLDALSDLKSSFNPGSSMPGYYRYYSSSHPDPSQQGMRDLSADAKTGDATQAAGLILLESPTQVLGFRKGTSTMETVDVTAGLPVMRANTPKAVGTATHQIATLSFAQMYVTKDISIPLTTTSRQTGYPRQTLISAMVPQLVEKASFFDDSATVEQRFDYYKTLVDASNAVFDTIGLVDRSGLTIPTLAEAFAPTEKNAPKGTKLSKGVALVVPITGGGSLAPNAAADFELANTEYRNLYGVNIPVISSYRDPASNTEIRGAANSNHMSGNALDVQFSEWPKVKPVLEAHNWKQLGGTFVRNGVTQSEDNHFDYKGPRTANPVVLTLTIGEQFTSTPMGILTIANSLASFVGGAVAVGFHRRVQELTDTVGAPGKPTANNAQANTNAYANLNAAWANYLNEIVPQEQAGTSVQGEKNAPLVVQVPAYNDKMEQYTPVFPVSDERGYEVTGVYAYGRGLSIEPGGNFQQLQNSSPFENVSVDAIDSFLVALRRTTSPSKALGILTTEDPEAAAELAAAAGLSTTQLGQEVQVATPTSGQAPTQFDNAFNAFVSSSRDASQKITATNAAFGLADLGLTSTRQVCECKGAEADVLLMAFNEESFLSVDQPDEVSAWLADRYAAAAGPWQQAQNALTGTTADIRTRDLAAQFEAAKGTFLSGVGTGLAALEQAAKVDLRAAGQQIQQDAAGIPELSDDIAAFLASINPNTNPDEG